MTTAKVNCTRCSAEILPTTAAKNGGLCRPCRLGNKPTVSKPKVRNPTIGKKTGINIGRTYATIKELVYGIALTIAGGGLAGLFGYNIFTGFLGDSWFFRYVYSSIFVLLSLLFAFGGVALVIFAVKKITKRN